MIPARPKAVVPFLALLGACISVASASEPAFCPADLEHMNWHDLEAIYRQADPGRIPSGFMHGRVVYCPDDFLVGVKSAASRFLWKGKIFCPEEGTLVNQWCGLKAIRATVAQGTSWLDCKPSIILDYSQTSRVWSHARDEMREVSPGVYLGAMYLEGCPEPKLKLFFVLRTCD